ncbi:MAG: SMP-30/gluconolactonase/LRE family protein [Pseudomonadota bacterium]|nr:SMP-30/gluconolactonase/LRE family protein [Pseudomonadota bacterium]
MDIELVAEGLEFPEGPVAMADGSILLTEIKAGRVTRVAPDGQKDVLVETGGGPNGLAIGPDGALWIANNGGAFTWLERGGLTIPGPTPDSHQGGSIQRYDFATCQISTIYEACDGRRLISPNDLVFDAGGGFWFTDHGCTTADGRRFGALYYAMADGSGIVRQRHHLLSPNGVGLSPDQHVVFVADTHHARLWAFDVEGPGVLAPAPPLAPGRIVAALQGNQLLDSLAVEAGGKVCVATIVNGGITAFDPDGSVEHYPFPDFLCTNICFGGSDMRDAWITASSTGKLYKARWPRPGLKLAFNA